MEKQKALWSVVFGAISAFSEQYALIIAFVLIVVVMDTITGIVGAKAQGEKITSEKGRIGFWKKVTLFLALFFGFFLDYFIPYVVSKVGVTLPISTAIFGMTVGCYICLNEGISICENLYKANPNILPAWIVKLLTSAKDQIDAKGEDDAKGN